jgi:hypothetical protein
MGILDTATPPPAPVQARTVQPMGEDMEQPKRIGRPPGSKNKKADEPKKRRRRRRKGPYAKLADRVAATPPGNGHAFTQHVKTTFAALEATIDIDQCDEQLQMAFKSHKEAVGLMP